jgi:hypothetical protein
MPITNPENNTITFMPHEMVDLHYLKAGTPHKPEEIAEMLGMPVGELSTGQKYDLKEMRQFTFSLMEKLMINHRRIEATKTLDSFSEEDKVRLRPFASFLATIDGNCFVDLIDQYIPEAYSLITVNGRRNLDMQLANMNR